MVKYAVLLREGIFSVLLPQRSLLISEHVVNYNYWKAVVEKFAKVMEAAFGFLNSAE